MLLQSDRSHKGSCGFTLAEVVITIGIVALVIQGTVLGYVFSSQRAEWSAYSLAAHSSAMQGVEQMRSAKWDPQAWPVVDELPPTNFTQAIILDVPVAGKPIYATNYVSLTNLSANPPLRQLRTDCVWYLIKRGPFTNTVITQRAPDQ